MLALWLLAVVVYCYGSYTNSTTDVIMKNRDKTQHTITQFFKSSVHQPSSNDLPADTNAISRVSSPSSEGEVKEFDPFPSQPYLTESESTDMNIDWSDISQLPGNDSMDKESGFTEYKSGFNVDDESGFHVDNVSGSSRFYVDNANESEYHVEMDKESSTREVAAGKCEPGGEPKGYYSRGKIVKEFSELPEISDSDMSKILGTNIDTETLCTNFPEIKAQEIIFSQDEVLAMINNIKAIKGIIIANFFSFLVKLGFIYIKA